jgi:hypothetical protein
MKLKKLWDLGITVFMVIFIYFILKEYFPVIIYGIESVFSKALQDLSGFLQSL